MVRGFGAFAFVRAWVALVVLFGSARVGAAELVRVVEGLTELDLGGRLEVAYDSTGALRIEDAMRDALVWKASAARVPAFGYRVGAEWARITLDDARSEGSEPLVLEHGYGQTDRIEVYEVAEGRVLERRVAGDQVPLREWSAIAARFPAFELAPRRGPRTLFLRVSGESSHQLPTTLFARSAYDDHRRRDLVAQSLFFGALVIMAAYNALLAVATRSRMYAVYVGYIASYALLSATLAGFLGFAEWLPRPCVNLAVTTFIPLVGISSLAFTMELLPIARERPWVHAFRLAALLLASAAIAPAIVGYATSVKFMLAIMAPWVVTLLGAGLRGALRGERIARLYLLGWSSFVVGCAVIPLRVAGLIPTNFFSVNGMLLGSLVELLVLSFALADRIKALEAKVAAEQAKALAAAHEAVAANERALLEERRLGELRDEFVANTSHELRTPLNGMMGLVQAVILREGEGLGAASKQSLDGVVKSGQRLAALVGDLLDFSRGQRDALRLQRVPTSMKRQATLVLDLLAPTVETRSVALVNDVPEGLDAADADPHRLQQVLFNLVGNAVKFTPTGAITVSAKRTGPTLTVRVSDTGHGIAEEAQTRIFQAFTQADGTIERRFGGTGLGLAIAKQIVEAHGGTIGVISTPGFGATFWFTLPVAAEAAPLVDDGVLSAVIGDKAEALRKQIEAAGGANEESAPNEPLPGFAQAEERPVGDSLEVLVVDDEPVNRQVLVELLGLAGHRVRAAADGVAGLAAVRARTPDLVLLDVMMPGKSGYEVLSELRVHYNEAELTVVLLTAKAQERDLVEGFRRGASDYMLKPFSASEVNARVQHQARLRAAMRATAAAESEGDRLRVTLAQAEEQLLHAERLATLGAATASVAHDLLNPLHHVRTAFGWIGERAERLEQAVEAAPALRQDYDALKKYTSLGAASGANALAIADALRLAARSDAGVSEVVHLENVVRDALVILGHKLRGVRVEQSVDGSVCLRGRRSEALQLVMNLVGNAADALEGSEREKCIRVGISQEEGSVTLVVEDSGPGVPGELQSRIFEPFFTTKPSGVGTGLGLATVRTVVRRWGATLDVGTSDALGGAAFHVRIPGGGA